jgi:cytochrome c556
MIRIIAGTAIAAIALIGSSAGFAGEFDKPVKARQSLMQIYSFNLGMIGAMVKGEAEYDADMAKNAADNLLAAATMKNGPMWPKGSDAGALGDMTRAKPEIWSTYPRVAEKGKALATAAANMASEAGNGLDALKAGLGEVGKACKGCHEDFRVPKKN